MEICGALEIHNKVRVFKRQSHEHYHSQNFQLREATSWPQMKQMTLRVNKARDMQGQDHRPIANAENACESNFFG